MAFYWPSFLYAIIAFALLYFLLNRYAFGPLFSVMEKRRQMIAEQIENAEQSRKQAEQHLEEQKQALQEARREAYDIIEQAKRAGTRQAEEIVQAAREEADRLREQAMRDIESEKNKALSAIKSQVSGLSVLIASKIIEKQIDEQSHKELVEQYLQEVGNRK